MNPMALLGLLGDLYAQVTQLSNENAQLKALLEQKHATPPTPAEPNAGDDPDALYARNGHTAPAI